MHDIGKPRTRKFLGDGTVTFHHHDVVGAKLTRKRMQALRFSNDDTDAVARLVELHLRFHGYGSGEWTDSAVRRYVRDAGDQLERLHVLTRADCTTRNRAQGRPAAPDVRRPRGADRPAAWSRRSWRPCGRPSTATGSWRSWASRRAARSGEAYHHLLELRLDRGPMEPEEAEVALRVVVAGS